MVEWVEIGDARLALGDCREILPTIERDVDFLTDPPYGIGFKYGGNYTDAGGEAYRALIAPLKGRNGALLQYPVEMMRDIVPILGAPADVLAWVYPSNLSGRHFRLWGLWGLEADLSQVKQPARNPEDSKVVNLMVNSYSWWEQPQVKNTSAEKTGHPCQIPTSAMERVLKLTGIRSAVDPFMGSGTTGVACANLGRKFIGIEIEPRYFDIACRRIEKAYSQPRLFPEPAAKPPKQEAML